MYRENAKQTLSRLNLDIESRCISKEHIQYLPVHKIIYRGILCKPYCTSSDVAFDPRRCRRALNK